MTKTTLRLTAKFVTFFDFRPNWVYHSGNVAPSLPPPSTMLSYDQYNKNPQTINTLVKIL